MTQRSFSWAAVAWLCAAFVALVIVGGVRADEGAGLNADASAEPATGSAAASRIEFAAPQRLRSGDDYINVQIGHAHPLPIDWNGNGKLDLLVGQFGNGKLRLYRNVGTREEPRFDGYEYVQAGGRDAAISAGCCHGFGPQVVDLTGNGHVDLISGSWPGRIYFFPGVECEDGGSEPVFGARQVLLEQPAGDERVPATSVNAVDFNGNGHIDLLIGSMNGPIYIRDNRGTVDDNGLPQFGNPRTLRLGDEVFGTPPPRVRGESWSHPWGKSCPFAVDFNGNGLLDLVVFGERAIGLLLNVGTREQPRFERLIELTPGGERPSEGYRFKGSVVDFTGNGVLDLVWGNFGVERDQGRRTWLGHVFVAEGRMADADEAQPHRQ